MNPDVKKELLIVLPYGIGWKSIINEQNLIYLSDNNIKITFLSESDSLKPLNPNISFHNFLKYKRSKFEIIVGILRNYIFVNEDRKYSESIKIKNKIYGDEHKIFHISRMLFGKILSKSAFIQKTLSWIDLNISIPKSHSKIFEKHFDAVFFAYPFSFHVYPFIRLAKKNNIPTIAYVPSWDNITSKWNIPAKIDRLLVWNENMKNEAIEFLDYGPSEVMICGIPQYDMYYDMKDITSNEKFRSYYGIDSTKKIILYATGTEELTDAEPNIIDLIVKAIENNTLSKSCHLLVRLHPRRSIDAFLKLKNHPCVTLQTPGRPSDEFSDSGYKWKADVEDYELLANTIINSDLTVTVTSTVSIESCIFDTPVINVGFDGNQNLPYSRSVKRHFEYSHYSNISALKGVRKADNETELIEFLNLYLDSPNTDHKGRSDIVDNQCNILDGNSGKRMLDYIIQFIFEK